MIYEIALGVCTCRLCCFEIEEAADGDGYATQIMLNICDMVNRGCGCGCWGETRSRISWRGGWGGVSMSLGGSEVGGWGAGFLFE